MIGRFTSLRPLRSSCRSLAWASTTYTAGGSPSPAWIRWICGILVEFFRAVPVLVFMMLLFYGLPTVGIRMPPYWAVVIALIVYNGSVLAEALRAGIESLPRGQKEAAYAIGLRKNAVMRLVLLPQAVRAMLPVIVAQLVVTLKDTALGFIITYPELLYYAKRLMGQSGRPILPSIIIIGAIYIAMCLVLSGIARWLEIRTRHSPRAGGKPPVLDDRRFSSKAWSCCMKPSARPWPP